MKHFFDKNIRTVLTIRYTLVVALLMFFYSAINLAFQYQYLSKQLDQNLQEDLEIIEEILLTNELIINPRKILTDHHPKPYERFVEIWSDSGTALYHSSVFEFEEHPEPPQIQPSKMEPELSTTTLQNGATWRTIAASVPTSKGMRIIRISMNESELFGQLLDIFQFMSLITPFFLILAVVTGYILAREALKPIDIMVSQAKKIGTGNLQERLTILNPNDELGNLATVTNDLLNRISRSFQQLKNFTADASHELRTPLTAMRSVGEVGLQSGQPPEYYREVIGSMLEENNRLTHLVDSLLFLSKADSGTVPLTLERFDLNDFLQETIDILLILAEEKYQRLSLACPAAIALQADKTLLRRAILNLLDNAIKYTPPGGAITISAEVSVDRATINVADTGTGIPKQFAEKIFDRFYRIDKDRARETGGVGLGLSIVHWVVSIHSGRVRVEEGNPGSIFIVEMPLSHPPHQF